mmetsp:Transcript_148/g.369  ORF Transcript_148/g.369 Transcript_148/m.369 type:complete len:223 (-) Transcript_148:10-678(-)
MSKRAREGAPVAAATPAAATPEEEILRQRLLAKETSLRNLTKRYLAFAAAVETAPVEECEKMYQGLLRELAAYEFGMAKARTMITVNVQQVASYEAMEGEIGAEMSRTSEEISALSKKLEEERTLRQQKEQYAALARRINQLPPRAATQQEIGALSSELETLRREGEELSATMADRAHAALWGLHARAARPAAPPRRGGRRRGGRRRCEWSEGVRRPGAGNK